MIKSKPTVTMYPHNQVSGYYWRDYKGRIPDDAVPGGRMINGTPTYIGQAFCRSKSCIVPAVIYPHQPDVYFEQSGVNRADFAQILCSSRRDSFKWLPVDNRNFHVQTIHYNLVRGGIEDGNYINIGRIQYQGEVVIGKTISFTTGDAKLWFLHNNQKHDADYYEVLTFHGPQPN